MRLLWAVGITVIIVSTASAQQDGTYEGVVPGKAADPAHLLGKPGELPVRVTWPGFQLLPDGRSRIFIQMTGLASHEVSRKGQRLEVRLKDTKLPGSNNKRRLITRYFNTPVLETRLRARKGDVVASLQLREPIEPVLSSETAASGYRFLYITFPAGKYVANAQTPPPASTASTPPTSAPTRTSQPSAKPKPELDAEKPPR
jgi:hypothetical protein